MTRIALALLVLSFGGCNGKSAGPTTSPGPSKMNPGLEIKLVAQPTKLSLADRPAFKIGLEANNRGSAPIDPQLHDAVLTANGERSYAWDLAIQNGARDESWTKLPPGKSISISWPLGEALFEKPGTYELVLTHGAQKSSVVVEVTP
jgi:hypothetical protein